MLGVTKMPALDFDELKSYKKQAITAAKELCYGEDVVKQIVRANSNTEIDRILKSARLNMK